jgi:hypothetical protein
VRTESEKGKEFPWQGALSDKTACLSSRQSRSGEILAFKSSGIPESRNPGRVMADAPELWSPKRSKTINRDRRHLISNTSFPIRL